MSETELCKNCGKEIERCTVGTVGLGRCKGYLHVNGGHYCMVDRHNGSDTVAEAQGVKEDDGGV